MDEHVHKWLSGEDMIMCSRYHVAHCECSAVMGEDELERRLNATERLPAYAAEQIADGMELNFEEGQTGYFRLQQLRAYADILEGKGGDDD